MAIRAMRFGRNILSSTSGSHYVKATRDAVMSVTACLVAPASFDLVQGEACRRYKLRAVTAARILVGTPKTEAHMTTQEFLKQLDARIAQFDLLCHPFYKAWSAGELSRRDLREYAEDYYHHVNAFPTYLAELSMRLEEGELRRAVLANLADEKGWGDATDDHPEHAELWLDFVEGMGASRSLRGHGTAG